MNEQLDIDAKELDDEVERYLAVVDAFRAADCEPTWRADSNSLAFDSEPDRLGTRVEKSTR
jgi:hypothetical protein